MPEDSPILIGGPEKRPLFLAPYSPAWPAMFQYHAQIIAKALGPTALRIHHIGSTSVPGLAAKPIIDIVVIVPNSADETTYLPHLVSVGYVLRVREPDFHEHRMFRTPALDVHIHIYSPDSPEISRNLLFRDRLRSHPADRARYEQVKRTLTQQDWPDMNAYANAKTEIIEQIIAADRESR